MAYTRDVVRYVYDKTDGHCEYCDKRLSIKNYGVVGAHGAWHVDHSVARANGGTDHPNNLFPACIECNQVKGARNGSSFKASLERQGVRDSGPDWGGIIVGGLLAAVALKALKDRSNQRPPPDPYRWPGGPGW